MIKCRAGFMPVPTLRIDSGVRSGSGQQPLPLHSPGFRPHAGAHEAERPALAAVAPHCAECRRATLSRAAANEGVRETASSTPLKHNISYFNERNGLG
jgi:hypothetical protein